MARIRYNEFHDFCLNKGKNRKINGNLTMKGNEVFSYYTKIAEVDRDNKIVKVNDGDFRRSQTTNRHLQAIYMGFKFLPDGWTMEKVMRY